MEKSFCVNAGHTRLLVFIFCFAVFSTFGQDRGKPPVLTTNVWSEGSIMTKNGNELIGLVRFQNVVDFEDHEKQLTLTAKDVVAFEFFDDQTQKQRLFYSFPYQDKDSVIRPQFFESLIELESFALLSKTDPVDISRKLVRTDDYWNGSRISEGYSEILVTLTFSETLYLRDSEGNIKPYLRIENKDIDGRVFDRKRTKSKVLDSDLLVNVLRKDVLEKLEKFASENKLSFRDKDNLLEIFRFCKENLER